MREIRKFDGMQKQAGLHAAVALVLDDAIDISRGDMIVRERAAPDVVSELDATLCWLSETPLDLRRRYTVRHTTREARAHFAGLDHLWDVSTQEQEPAPATLRMNDIGRVALTLAQPVFADRYTDNRATGSFILIDETTHHTVAAGMIQ